MTLQQLEPRRMLFAGDLDATFSNDGTAAIDVAAHDAAIVPQSDGKLVVAAGGEGVVVIARLLSNGAFDSTFGSDGEFSFDLGSGKADATDLALRPDGKIVIVAAAKLLRLTSAGKLDTTFGGGDGIVSLPGVFTDVALQSDGKVVIVGGSVVRRYTPGGAVDTSFGTSGAFDVATIIASGPYQSVDVNISPQQQIILTGQIGAEITQDTLVLRLTAAGAPDATFGSGDGAARIDIDDSDVPYASAIQSDGKIVVAQGEDDDQGFIFRLDADGSRDDAFGTVRTRTGNLHSLAIQEDGKIVAVGAVQLGDIEEKALGIVRVNGDGSFDTTYSFDGQSTVQFDSIDAVPTAVAIDASGKIVAAGVGGAEVLLARVESSGPVPPAFARVSHHGTLLVEGTSGDDNIHVFENAVQMRDDYVTFDSFRRIRIDGGDGSDGIFVDVRRPATISGGDGDDLIHCERTGRSDLTGNAGNDLLIGSDFADHLSGGDGDDTLDGGLGADDLLGENGSDTADYSRHGVIDEGLFYPLDLALSLDDIANDGGGSEGDDLHGDIETILAGDGNDTLTGSSAANRLTGGNGNDSIDGAAGDDTINPGVGADTLAGGAGSDLADYSSRSDDLALAIGAISGGSGSPGEGDIISTTIEKLRGGSGDDRISGSGKNNVLYGGAGNDTIDGNGGADALFGGIGNDKLFGGSGGDYLEGNSGRDTLIGGDGDDTARRDERDFIVEAETVLT